MSRIVRSRRPNPPEKVKIAIALSYNPETDRAPSLVAKGGGRLAERIVEEAKAHGIPVISDPIALEALRFLDIGQEIPPRVYHMVAEILAFVMSLGDRSERRPPASLRVKTGAPRSGAPDEPYAGEGSYHPPTKPI